MQKRQQLNFGPYDPDVVEEICKVFEKIIYDLREKGMPRPTRKDLAASPLKIFAQRIMIWLDNPNVSYADSEVLAKKALIRKRLMKDFKGNIDSFLGAVWQVAENHAGEVAEVMLNGP